MQAGLQEEVLRAAPIEHRRSSRLLRRRTWLAALLVITALLPTTYVCWKAKDGFQLGEFGDDELYLGAAKSLTETGDYRIPSLQGQPYQTKYPPLYPLLLAVVWKLKPVFPANLKWFVLLNWGLWVCFLAASFVAFRRLQLAPTARLVALVLLASNAACQFLAIHLLPEALMSTFVIAAILLAERVSESPSPVLLTVGAAAAASCACLIKTAVLPLAITIPVVFVLRRQYRWAAYFTGLATPLIGWWLIWSATHRAQVSDPVLLYYVDYLGFYRLNVHWTDLPSLLSYNFRYFQGMFRFVLPALSHADGALSGVILIPVALSLIGLIRLFRKTRFLHASAFCAVYLLELLMWNFNPNGRFLYPLIPFFVAGFVYEVTYAIDLIGRSWPARAQAQALKTLSAGAISAALIGLSLFASVASARVVVMDDIPKYRRIRTNLIQAYRWIDQHLPKGANFAAYDDGGLYLYTGRHAIRNQIMTRPSITHDIRGMFAPIIGIADFARRNRIAYVLWNAPDYSIDEQLRDRLLARNAGLSAVYESRGVRIYRVY